MIARLEGKSVEFLEPLASHPSWLSLSRSRWSSDSPQKIQSSRASDYGFPLRGSLSLSKIRFRIFLCSWSGFHYDQRERVGPSCSVGQKRTVPGPPSWRKEPPPPLPHDAIGLIHTPFELQKHTAPRRPQSLERFYVPIGIF